MCMWSEWLEEFESTYVLTTSRFWMQVSWKIENTTRMNSPSQTHEEALCKQNLMIN
jgi:hypothetical protein